MGAYLSEPITEKESVDEENDMLMYGASSMQGWRMSQEDAHNSILDYDKNSSLFAVYDGHGGSEVATYCAQQLPKFLRIHEQYVLGNYEQALREAFVDFDGTLIQEQIIEELRKLMPEDHREFESGEDDDDDDETENLAELRQEGNMPLAELLEKYKEVRSKLAAGNANDADEPAQALAGASGSSSSGGQLSRRTTNTAARAGGSSSAPEAADANGTAGGSKVANGNAKAPAADGEQEDGEQEDDDDSDDTDDEEFDKTKASADAKKSDSDESSSGESDGDEYVDTKVVVQAQVANREDDDDGEETNEEDDSFLNSMMEGPGSSSGCTAVVALLVDRELFVANAGDSRCVVCRLDTALEMSYDHKPEDDVEQQRIEKAGGRVTLDGRVNGGLNLSRALGDHAYKTNKSLKAHEQMISPLPDVRHITIQPEDEFMIIACDGIWNFMSSQEVIDFVRVRINDGREKISSICEELFTACLAGNTMGDGTGCDNMTAVIVRFKPALYQRPVQASKKRCATSPTATPEEEKAKRIKTDDATAADEKAEPIKVAEATTEDTKATAAGAAETETKTAAAVADAADEAVPVEATEE